MKLTAFIIVVACAALPLAAQSNGTPPPIPSNPDSLFGPSSTDATSSTDSTSSTTQQAPAASGSQPQSPDSMFQGGMVEKLPTKTAEQNPTAASSLLESKGVQLGGSIESSYTAYGYWRSAYPTLTKLSDGFSNQLVPTLKGTLYFDARPDPHFRVFGKAIASYPFQSTTDLTYTDPNATPQTQSAHLVAPNIDIFELYSDFDFQHKVFFRVGKQVVNWGVGYFFSPADVISLTPIDPQNPTVEREGPLALKTNVPFAGVDNLYLYLIANQGFAQGGTFTVNDVAVAPKAEFVVGNYEIGVGGYYQRNQRPKAMVTASGSIGKIGVFGEAVVSQGADKTLVRSVSGSSAYESYTDTTTPFFQGTAGFNYLQTDWNFSLYAQYYYNGQGYPTLTLEKAANSLYALQQAGIPHQGPTLVPQDLLQPGQHYGAAVASLSDIRNSNVSASLFWEGNFSDGSGVVSPSVSYAPFDYMTLTAASHIAYGPDNSEFVRAGRMSISFGASLGSGSF